MLFQNKVAPACNLAFLNFSVMDTEHEAQSIFPRSRCNCLIPGCVGQRLRCSLQQQHDDEWEADETAAAGYSCGCWPDEGSSQSRADAKVQPKSGRTSGISMCSSVVSQVHRPLPGLQLDKFPNATVETFQTTLHVTSGILVLPASSPRPVCRA